MSDNRGEAAWQRQPGEPLELGLVDHPIPGADEILVRNGAVAINPVDWLLQDSAIFPWLDYPAILGSDVAGEIVAVGSGVGAFQVGDRVLGQAVGTTNNRPTHGAFQAHTLVLANMAARIPPGLSYTDAAVLPLGLGTAACGLYQKDHLGLRHPSLSPAPTGEVVLVWGGSSSVGCNAIQLAVASGYECVATASPANFDLLRRLGASQVFDHRSLDVVNEVVHALAGRRIAGALHATGSMAHSFAVVSRCEGRRFVSTTLSPPDDKPASVNAKHIYGTSLKDDEVSRVVYADFLPQALAEGRYQAAPPTLVVAQGLTGLQVGLQAQKDGVSAVKIVVDLRGQSLAGA